MHVSRRNSSKGTSSQVFETLWRHFGDGRSDISLDPTLVPTPLSDDQPWKLKEDHFHQKPFKSVYDNEESTKCSGLVLAASIVTQSIPKVDEWCANSISSDGTIMRSDVRCSNFSFEGMLSMGKSSRIDAQDAMAQGQDLSECSDDCRSAQSLHWITSGIATDVSRFFPGSSSMASLTNISNSSGDVSSNGTLPLSVHDGWLLGRTTSLELSKAHSLPKRVIGRAKHITGVNGEMVTTGTPSDISAHLMGDLSCLTSKKDETPQRKLEKDRPKRPLSAYNIFFKEERQRILEILPGEILKEGYNEDGQTKKRKRNLTTKEKFHAKVDFHRLAKLVGQRWRGLDPVTLQSYKDRAFYDFRRYKKEEFDMLNAKKTT